MALILNQNLERGRQFTYSALGVNDDISAGDIVVVGANLVGLAVEAAQGATKRASEIAAGNIPEDDRCELLIEHNDVTVPKMAGDDSIGKGVKVFYSVDDAVWVSALSKVDASGDCYQAGVTLEASNDTDDTIRICFNGIGVAVEAGTG
jgi:hypothetical protein